MGGKYEFGEKAYVKAALHAVKHTTIGRVDGNGDDFTLQIVDSVPLFHTHLALLPMLELALLQIDEHLAMDGQGLQVVGYYHANERYDDYEVNPVARKIGDHVIRYCSQAVLLLLDNKLLTSLSTNTSHKPVFNLYTKDSSRAWKQSSELVLQEKSANNILIAYMAEGRHQKVVDFDEHLDDITKDWLNRALFD